MSAADLPPVGARVRTTFGAEGVVEKVGTHPYSHVYAPLSGALIWFDGRPKPQWVTADEIAEVLP